ncbi:MAG: SAM-dependent methyltransferase [Flavobacteriales bacterium]
MTTITSKSILDFQSKPKKTVRNTKQEMIHFYNEATEDYSFWSKDLNMHFGYFTLFKTNPFKRDDMLNEMNNYLFSLLNIDHNLPLNLIDLGCGMGGTLRHALNRYKNINITGCTISPFQVEEGNKLIHSPRGKIINQDYCKTHFEDNSFDGGYALESFSHSGCSDKALKEAYRIIKPGSKLVIVDAFVRSDTKEMNSLSEKVYNGLCDSWALDNMGNINKVKFQLEKLGFKDIQIKNIWYRVAPSVLHVPFAIVFFILKNVLQKKTIKPQSYNNLKGSFYALLSSLCMQDFGYYSITAKK